MVVETVLDLFFKVLSLAFQGLEVIYLPHQLINTLATILCYGVWIVGLDIMAIFVSIIWVPSVS